MKSLNKRGGFTMTEVLNICNMQEYVVNNNDSKIENIKNAIRIKTVDKYEEIINKNIVKDKEIRNGRATIKGTRITPKELIFCIAEKINADEKKRIETNYEGIKKYLSEEYPSITNEEQIEAALYYTIKYEINIFKYIIATFVS